MERAELQTAIAVRLATARSELETQSGGAALCQIHKEGRVTGGLKYSEGTVVALRSAQRLLENRDQPYNPIKQALDGLLRQWVSNLELHQHQSRPSMPWIAYYQGGVDALNGLLSNLE